MWTCSAGTSVPAWPSWRHTSYCWLRKAGANTGVFSQLTQSTDNSRLCTRSSPNSQRGFRTSWDSHRTMLSSSLCNDHHTNSVTRSTATSSSCLVRSGTCPNPGARSLPQFPMAMQSHSARYRGQDPSSCARAAALKEGEDTRPKKKVYDSSGSTTIIHLGKKPKLLGSYFQEPVYLSARLCWQ